MIKKYRNLFAHPLLPYAVTLVETPNSKLQTPNSKLQTPNSKLQTPNR
jgi:hypothetical protein